MATPINNILNWFKTGDFPTEAQFAASWTSFYHKDEYIPLDKVENLNTKLQNKVDKSVYEVHLTNAEAHSTTLAKLDTSNLNDANIQAWKGILGVGELPSNIATVDENNLIGNVYKKDQVNDMIDQKLDTPTVAANYLLFWNNSNIAASNLYYDGSKFGLGTTSPTEALHLNNGRLRSKALVFDENTEVLPQQIIYKYRAFYGTDVAGSQYKFMFQNYTDLHDLIASFNDNQKMQIRNDLRLSGEKFSVGTPRIDVLLLPFIDNTKDFIQYTTLVGINLFVDNVTPSAYIKIKRIKDVNGTNLPNPETYDVDNFTVLQNFPNNLNFGINWFTKPEGYYQVFVSHNGMSNVSSPELIVKAGLTYSQFNGITNWTLNSGSGTVNDTELVLGKPCNATTDYLISQSEINQGFMVSFSVNNDQGNLGANFVNSWQCGLIGADNVFYGVAWDGVAGGWRIANGPGLGLTRNDTIHIAYYNGVVYVIAEGNGKTYQQFNNTLNLYPRRFLATRGVGGVGSLSMTLIGKIILS